MYHIGLTVPNLTGKPIGQQLAQLTGEADLNGTFYFRSVCVLIVQVLARLCGCAGSPEASLDAYAMTKTPHDLHSTQL